MFLHYRLLASMEVEDNGLRFSEPHYYDSDESEEVHSEQEDWRKNRTIVLYRVRMIHRIAYILKGNGMKTLPMKTW